MSEYDFPTGNEFEYRSDSDPYEGFFEGLWYHWTCGKCGEMNEEEEDIRGQTIKCTACNEKNEIIGTM